MATSTAPWRLEAPPSTFPANRSRLLMVTGDLVAELRQNHSGEPATAEYLERIDALAGKDRGTAA